MGVNNLGGNVNVSSLPSLPAGNNNIGDVDVVSLPSIPAGSNNIGRVHVAGYNYAWKNSIGSHNSIKVGAGVLHAIVVNGSEPGSTVVVYDGTTAGGGNPVIASITPPLNGTTIFYDVAFTNGLSVGIASAVADITIVYI
jgi:hypothetical protein